MADRRGEEIAPGMWEVVSDPKPEWRYRCPKCKARIGEPCIYLQDAQKWETAWQTGTGGHRYRRDVQVILHRKGDPTRRSHNERLNQKHRAERPKPAPVVGPSPAVKALWDYDRLEYRAMREWLHANHRLFEAPSALPTGETNGNSE